MKQGLKDRTAGKYRTLAIIGNGFDLAHGYKTLYANFADSTNSPSLDVFKAECDADENIETWYLFEENINRLTRSYFLKRMSGDNEREDIVQCRDRLRSIFEDIHVLLSDYLREEVSKHPVKKLISVKKYLKRKTYALSFNYTDVAEKYPCTVYHVHGSLSENDIILGYDFRDEPCLADYDDMRWSKCFCREGLAYRRYLRNELQMMSSDKKYQEMLDSFETYRKAENSGRGIDEEVETSIPFLNEIRLFIQAQRKNDTLPHINLSKIKTLSVMGHGIEADQSYLKKILKRCTALKKVVVFRYEGESDEEYEKKKNFFRPYCKRIVSKKY